MAHDWTDRALALSAVFQAADAVTGLARTGTLDPAVQAALLDSILITDPASTEAVYPDRFVRREALRALQQRLSGQHLGPEALTATRYAIALLHLARKLLREPARLQAIGAGIEAAKAQAEHFGADHENVRARFDALYQAHISTLNPRILVQGDPAILSTPHRQAQIRALLLAGIRAAVLYHQVGGRRWHILLRRRRLLEGAERLLREA